MSSQSTLSARARRWAGAAVVLVASQLALPGASAEVATVDDHVHPRGDALFYGSTGATELGGNITGIAATPTGEGYWLVGTDGSVHEFGDAGFHGSLVNMPLNSPIVDIAAHPSGDGYWLVAEDGGVFAFNAPFFGSMGGQSLAGGRIVAIEPTSTGAGYWLAADNGGVYPFGNAVDFGDLVGTPLDFPDVVTLVRTADNGGYWLVTADGGIVDFGNATEMTSATVEAADVVGAASNPARTGLWLATASGPIESRGTGTASFAAVSDSRPVVDIASAPDADPAVDGVWVASEGNGPQPGAMEGVVTDDLGDPAPGVCVSAYSGYPDFTYGSAVTSVTGYYHVADLDPDDYSVAAYDCDGMDYLGDFDEGTVTIASGTTTEVDFSVVRAATVSGVVTDPSGNPLEDVCVNVMTEDRQWGSFAYTSVTGYYRAGGLPSGTYHTEFVPCDAVGDWAIEWWNNQPSEATAEDLVLTKGTNRTGINAELAQGSAISGVVTSEATGQPVSGVCVAAYVEGGTAVSHASTSVTGFYRVASLPQGTYTVDFDECHLDRYGPEWWNNKPNRAAADPVTTVAGQTHANVNAALSAAGRITGVVRDTTGSPIESVCVTAYDSDGTSRSFALSSVTGYYTLGGLGTTSYKVLAEDCIQDRFAYEWYSEKATESAADAAPVSSGNTTPNIDFTLAPPGTVSGTVTDGDGALLDDVCVEAVDADGVVVSDGLTTVTGYYRLYGLRAATHTVHFEDCGEHGLPDEWYDDAPDRASADPVMVVAGSDLDVDAVLGDSRPSAPSAPTATGGNGSATVSWTPPASNGSPISGYTVTASPGGATVTTSATSTSFGGLANGTTYTFTVQATNGLGNGAPSAASNAVTPATVPGAPTGVGATAGNGSATVSWTPPASNGGSAITGYTVTAAPGGMTATSAGTSAVVSGLANGTTYTFTVRATNAGGNGPVSAPSNAATPAPPPTEDVVLGQGSTVVVEGGQWLLVQGGGYGANQNVNIVVESTPQTIGTATTDSAGNFSITVLIPSNLGPGLHTLSATGPAAGGGTLRIEAALTLAPSLSATGYRFVASDGGVFAFGGGAAMLGSMGGKPLNSPVVAAAATPSKKGYWLAAADGGVFAFGDAAMYGSIGGKPLNNPIVGMAATPTGKGYWLVASDGGIFAFGDAPMLGSMGGKPLNKPVVGIAATPTGKGYWLVASDGGIFAFGDAPMLGSMGGKPLNKPVVGIAATPTGKGYWLVASDGGIFAFGDAPMMGSTGGMALNRPVIGMAATPTGNGYWLVASDGGVFSFGAPFFGSMGGQRLVAPVIAVAG